MARHPRQGGRPGGGAAAKALCRALGEDTRDAAPGGFGIFSAARRTGGSADSACGQQGGGCRGRYLQALPGGDRPCPGTDLDHSGLFFTGPPDPRCPHQGRPPQRRRPAVVAGSHGFMGDREFIQGALQRTAGCRSPDFRAPGCIAARQDRRRRHHLVDRGLGQSGLSKFPARQ